MSSNTHGDETVAMTVHHREIPPFQMPPVYREPLGLPLRWQDEQSGMLPKAVLAYFHHTQTPMLRPQMKIVVEYLRYYVHAPCWDSNPHHTQETCADLARLRSRILAIQQGPLATEDEIEAWLADCLEMGLDPL